MMNRIKELESRVRALEYAVAGFKLLIISALLVTSAINLGLI